MAWLYADIDPPQSVSEDIEEVVRWRNAWAEPTRIAPTAVLDTGRGFSCWWRLTEAVSGEDMDVAERVILGIEQAEGGDISVWNRARVMRLPGFVNGKTGFPTRVIRAGDSVYSFDEMALAYPPAIAREKYRGERAEMPATVPYPHDKMERLLEADARLRATWNKDRTDMADESISAYDMALATRLLRDMDESEVKACLLRWREKHGLPAGKMARGDYIQITLGNALESVRRRNAESMEPGMLRRGGGKKRLMGLANEAGDGKAKAWFTEAIETDTEPDIPIYEVPFAAPEIEVPRPVVATPVAEREAAVVVDLGWRGIAAPDLGYRPNMSFIEVMRRDMPALPPLESTTKEREQGAEEDGFG